MKPWQDEAILTHRLRDIIADAGSAKAAAAKLGFSASYIGDVLAGKKAASERLAAALGFEVKRVAREVE